MSTTSEQRPDDRLVTVISRWLARHADDDELRATIAQVHPDALAPEQAEAMEELSAELDRGGTNRGDLEMVARETLEAVALGG